MAGCAHAGGRGRKSSSHHLYLRRRETAEQTNDWLDDASAHIRTLSIHCAWTDVTHDLQYDVCAMSNKRLRSNRNRLFTRLYQLAWYTPCWTESHHSQKRANQIIRHNSCTSYSGTLLPLVQACHFAAQWSGPLHEHVAARRTKPLLCAMKTALCGVGWDFFTQCTS